MLKNKMLMSDS